MSIFKYKTRGMVSPQGKPRVYFSSHPDDFELYFKEVSDSILMCQNCAVYYMEQPVKIIEMKSDTVAMRKMTVSEMEKEHLENLEQMQLLVIPVTWKLLTTSNYTMDVEYPYAISHHIPVLPIIQESGILKMFGEKFGPTQFLDITVNDDTAIKFEDKLSNYLGKVLVGDEMAEKVRTAFDAYVFLSYRKKDRKYAQQLMKVIHKNDFCRDIAIWYDEFLTPGENFNDSIQSALKKSDLFVMSVTPNLVNEDNYIMTTEYPLAVQERKSVLPVEMVATDKKKLAEQYRGIPECVDFCDEDRLSEALLNVDVIRKLVFQKKDNTPEHNFFIGLAYLRGIDVEVDFHQAAELITASADAGFVEAVDMLTTMYRFGIGVEQNYDIMIQWQEKKIILLEDKYSKEDTVENLDILVQEILKCGDYYREISKYSRAEEIYRKADVYLEKSRLSSTSAILQRNRAMVFHRIGDVLLVNGNLAVAGQYMKKGLEITRVLAEQTNDRQTRQYMAASYLKMGDVCLNYRMGSIQDVMSYYKKCYEIREVLAEKDCTAKERWELSIVYNRLGALLQKLAQRRKTILKQNIEKEKKRKVLSGKIFGNYLKDREKEYQNDLSEIKELVSQAKYYFEKSRNHCEQYAEEVNTPEAKINLAICYNRLGDISMEENELYQENDFCAAKEYNEKYIGICETVVKEVKTEKTMRELYVSYQKYGETLYHLGDMETARSYYEKGHEICEELAGKSESPERKADLAVSYYRLESVYPGMGYQKKAIEICEELCKKYPEIEQYQIYLQIFKQ